MSPKFPIALVNGIVCPFDRATISLAHSVFLTSFGVYEAIQVDVGRPFCLRNHLQRLIISARWLSIELPPFDDLLAWGETLIRALPAESYALQILAIGATPTDPPLVAFLPKPIRTYPADLYATGATAITFEGERALPQCKSLNTLINYLARAEAQRQNALEAILISDGNYFEGARSNLFAVDAAGRLLTPPAAKTLSGITKEVVISEMAMSPYPVVEGDIPLDVSLRELFITSTSMHVMPITQLNGQRIGDGRVGSVTKMAAERFEIFYRTAMRKHLD